MTSKDVHRKDTVNGNLVTRSNQRTSYINQMPGRNHEINSKSKKRRDTVCPELKCGNGITVFTNAVCRTLRVWAEKFIVIISFECVAT